MYAADTTVSVHLDNGVVLRCTPDHAIYAEGKGWVAAESLGIGTSLVKRAGPTPGKQNARVVKVERGLVGSVVHNLAVKNDFTYFVGDANKPGNWT